MSMLDALRFAENQQAQRDAAEQARRAAADGVQAEQAARDAMIAATMLQAPTPVVEAPVAPVPMAPAIPDEPIGGDGLRILIPDWSGGPRARVRADASHSHPLDATRVQASASEAAMQTSGLPNKQAYAAMLRMLRDRGLRGRELVVAKAMAWELRQKILGKLVG